MSRDIVFTDKAAKPPASYSQAVKAAGLVFVSGTAPTDPATGAIVGETIQEQTRQCLTNIAAILDAAGSSLDRIVSVTIVLAEEDDFAGMNEEYLRWFPVDPPARQGARLPVRIPGLKVSIAAIAAIAEAPEAAGVAFSGRRPAPPPRLRCRGASASRRRIRGLHLCDELAQPVLGLMPSLGHAHRLLDHHEAPRQQPHVAHAPRIGGIELLAHAGRDVQVLREEQVGDRRRRGRAHQRRRLEFARQPEVVGAAAPDHHARAPRDPPRRCAAAANRRARDRRLR